MGVAGLWDVLKPAAQNRSLTELAIKEGFEANPDGKRGFRLGIDASIWFFHAEYGREGENPVLRTLFFRCATLMHTTFLPLFVFDGPKRPDVKRGKKVNRTPHKLIPGMKQIVEAFGFEWRMAPGEAEAELAYLNRIGVIDGVLSDDVDNFLFGATTVIRNSSKTLSGNRAHPTLNAAGKDDGNHTRVFRLQDISEHPDIQLTRGGMILIGLMSGGDYQQGGLSRCGVATAHGLARCGFGDRLYEAARTMDRHDLEEFLVTWRHELRQELRTNSMNIIGRKLVALSKAIPEEFPDIDVLMSYVEPITSESMGRESNNLKLTWSKEPNVAKLAETCEFYFEWGYKEAIIKRFRTVIWHSIVLRILRRAVLTLDEKAATAARMFPSTPRKKKANRDGGTPCGTPSKMITKHFSSLALDSPHKNHASGSDSEDGDDGEERLIVKVHSTRAHTSTDGMLEYRLEVAPKQLVRLAESGIKGIRVPEGPDEWASEKEDDDDEGAKKRGKGQPVDPESHLRLWMPACMVRLVEPALVQEFEDKEEAKRQKKANKGKRVPGSRAKAKEPGASKEKAPRKTQKKVAPAPPPTLLALSDYEDDMYGSSPIQKKVVPPPPLSEDSMYASSPIQKKAAPAPPPPFLALSDYEDDMYTSPIQQKPVKPNMVPRSRAVSISSSDDDEDLSVSVPFRLIPPTTMPLLPLNVEKSKQEARAPSQDEFFSSPVAKRTGIRDLTKKAASAASTSYLAPLYPAAPQLMTTPKKVSANPLVRVDRSHSENMIVPDSEPARAKARATASKFSNIPIPFPPPPVASTSTLPPKTKKASPAAAKKTAASTNRRRLMESDVSSQSDNEYDPIIWGGKQDCTSTSPSKRGAPGSTSSQSESERSSRVNKSPRKGIVHTSPQHIERPASPSPAMRQSKPLGGHVIEISDESDSANTRNLPPLLAARNRAANSRSSSAKLPPQNRQKKTTPVVSLGIIDLT